MVCCHEIARSRWYSVDFVSKQVVPMRALETLSRCLGEYFHIFVVTDHGIDEPSMALQISVRYTSNRNENSRTLTRHASQCKNDLLKHQPRGIIIPFGYSEIASSSIAVPFGHHRECCCSKGCTITTSTLSRQQRYRFAVRRKPSCQNLSVIRSRAK